MKVIYEPGKRPIKAWVGERLYETFEESTGIPIEHKMVPDIEHQALTQLKNLAGLPFIHPNGIAVMPDVHAGKGSTIGTVLPTFNAIIPAAVGVDIGCGMNAVRTSLHASDLPDSLKGIRDGIEAVVPLGAGREHAHGTVDIDSMPVGWTMIAHEMGWNDDDFLKKALNQLGSLGGGNHFIELCVDEAQAVWVMLHSGSRGIGNKIGTEYIARAKRNMERYFINLPDDDLAYFPEGTEDFQEYIRAVQWAQNYALENRRLMMRNVLAAVMKAIGMPFTLTTEAVNCHHNYVERENHFGKNVWVTRKGAVRAREGDLGIIPGSMGQQSYIVRGKGNLESYCSCSHGAGRVMSRAEAKRRFSLADLAAQTEGVECRKDADVIDEIPGAYKRLDVVMENQKDLVEIVHTLKAVLCVKGN